MLRWEQFGSEGRKREQNTLEIMADLLLLFSIFFFLSVNLNPWNYISVK